MWRSAYNTPRVASLEYSFTVCVRDVYACVENTEFVLVVLSFPEQDDLKVLIVVV